jgi:hypothetical protein
MTRGLGGSSETGFTSGLGFPQPAHSASMAEDEARMLDKDLLMSTFLLFSPQTCGMGQL